MAGAADESNRRLHRHISGTRYALWSYPVCDTTERNLPEISDRTRLEYQWWVRYLRVTGHIIFHIFLLQRHLPMPTSNDSQSGRSADDYHHCFRCVKNLIDLHALSKLFVHVRYDNQDRELRCIQLRATHHRFLPGRPTPVHDSIFCRHLFRYPRVHRQLQRYTNPQHFRCIHVQWITRPPRGRNRVHDGPSNRYVADCNCSN